jgi:post-segregation antitoxin (ccd killing protein)
MKRLNITIDEETYEKARAYAFVKKISLSKLIRESLRNIIDNKGENEIRLTESEERRFLDIINNEEFISSENLKKELGI